MDLKQESEIVNKILDNFQRLKTENAKLKLVNEKLRKQLKGTEENLYNRVTFLKEKIEQNEKLEKENRELKDALYECETMLRECSDLQWRLEKIMPTLKKINRKREKKYKYKVTHDEIIIAGPPDSLFPPYGGFMSDEY